MTSNSNKCEIVADIGVQIKIVYTDLDIIELRVFTWNGAFGGGTNLYVGNGQLEQTARKLKDFPVSPSDTREVVLGAFGPKFAGGAVSMRFYCTDRPGHAYLESIIESAYSPGAKVQSVALLLPIEAAAVDLFVEELSRLESSRSGLAYLRGLELISENG